MPSADLDFGQGPPGKLHARYLPSFNELRYSIVGPGSRAAAFEGVVKRVQESEIADHVRRLTDKAQQWVLEHQRPKTLGGKTIRIGERVQMGPAVGLQKKKTGLFQIVSLTGTIQEHWDEPGHGSARPIFAKALHRARQQVIGVKITKTGGLSGAGGAVQTFDDEEIARFGTLMGRSAKPSKDPGGTEVVCSGAEIKGYDEINAAIEKLQKGDAVCFSTRGRSGGRGQTHKGVVVHEPRKLGAGGVMVNVIKKGKSRPTTLLTRYLRVRGRPDEKPAAHRSGQALDVVTSFQTGNVHKTKPAGKKLDYETGRKIPKTAKLYRAVIAHNTGATGYHYDDMTGVSRPELTAEQVRSMLEKGDGKLRWSAGKGDSGTYTFRYHGNEWYDIRAPRPSVLEQKPRPKQAAGPGRGKAQKAILAYVAGMEPGQRADLSDMSAHRSFRGIHFSQVLSSAEALAKQKQIRLVGTEVQKPDVGVTPKSSGLPRPQQIKDWVKANTYFELDYEEPNRLSYKTRRHGNVGDETPGPQDIAEAQRVTKEIRERFGVGTSGDIVDEWVDFKVHLDQPATKGSSKPKPKARPKPKAKAKSKTPKREPKKPYSAFWQGTLEKVEDGRYHDVLTIDGHHYDGDAQLQEGPYPRKKAKAGQRVWYGFSLSNPGGNTHRDVVVMASTKKAIQAELEHRARETGYLPRFQVIGKPRFPLAHDKGGQISVTLKQYGRNTPNLLYYQRRGTEIIGPLGNSDWIKAHWALPEGVDAMAREAIREALPKEAKSKPPKAKSKSAPKETFIVEGCTKKAGWTQKKRTGTYTSLESAKKRTAKYVAAWRIVRYLDGERDKVVARGGESKKPKKKAPAKTPRKSKAKDCPPPSPTGCAKMLGKRGGKASAAAAKRRKAKRAGKKLGLSIEEQQRRLNAKLKGVT